jgi:hypothetical protein
MNILLVHQNFPGQFKHLAPAMARQGHRVVALHINACPPVPDVELVRYPVAGRPGQGTHRWLGDLEVKAVRGEAAWQAAQMLREQGFVPDVIVAHPGWGESLFLQQVWPQARLGIYCEFFYHAHGADTEFDPEFGKPEPDHACSLQMKNANYELHFGRAHAGIAPTHWQASLFPEPFASRIAVIHDGLRTDQIKPDALASIRVQTAKGPVQLGPHSDGLTVRGQPGQGREHGAAARAQHAQGAPSAHCKGAPQPRQAHARHRSGAQDLQEFAFAQAHNKYPLMFGVGKSPDEPGSGRVWRGLSGSLVHG